MSQQLEMSKTVTIGLPLPNLVEYATDVSWQTRKSIRELTKYSAEHGINVLESSVRGINVAHNHNRLVHDFVGDWLLIIGSDHTFSEDALTLLLDAAEQEPFPRIIGGLCPSREAPYRYVITKKDEFRQLMFPIIPYLDFHPGATMPGSGEIIPVGGIGSGFCLYHRSVFDTVPCPWFQFAQAAAPRPAMESMMLDMKEGMSFPEFLEELADGKDVDIDPEILRAKAKLLRRNLALSRVPIAYGPDYYLCLNAGDYGFTSYCHLGVTVWHYDFIPVHPGYYIDNLRKQELWFKEALKGYPVTVDSVQMIRGKLAETLRMQSLNPDELELDYTKKQEPTNGTGDPSAEEEVPTEASPEEQEEVPVASPEPVGEEVAVAV